MLPLCLTVLVKALEVQLCEELLVAGQGPLCGNLHVVLVADGPEVLGEAHNVSHAGRMDCRLDEDLLQDLVMPLAPVELGDLGDEVLLDAEVQELLALEAKELHHQASIWMLSHAQEAREDLGDLQNS